GCSLCWRTCDHAEAQSPGANPVRWSVLAVFEAENCRNGPQDGYGGSALGFRLDLRQRLLHALSQFVGERRNSAEGEFGDTLAQPADAMWSLAPLGQSGAAIRTRFELEGPDGPVLLDPEGELLLR